jgi:histidinol-phosphate aminotransferase
MYKPPKKLDSFTPYEPLTGKYKSRLDVNESFIEIPLQEIYKAIKNVRFNRYPDPYSTETVEAFSRLFNVNPAHVVAGNGSDELIGLIAAGLLEKGDKVLTLTPDFPMYSFYSKLYELEVIELPKPDDFVIDIDKVINQIKENDIKCLFFSNPCNPTSLGIQKSEVKRLLTETDTLIVVDEAYMDFWTDQFGKEAESMLSEVDNYEKLIVLRTCSKSVALAGIRLGFAVANKLITRALRIVKSPFNVNSLTQAIGAEILSDRESYLDTIEELRKNSKSLYDAALGLHALYVFEKVYETKTNFVFVQVNEAEKIYEFLLEKGIAVRCFPPNHLRICAGTSEELSELVRVLALWKVQEIEGIEYDDNGLPINPNE